MTATPISRRTLLRGAGAALAIPWLEAMVPSRAFAGGGPVSTAPLRMGIYTVAGGTVIESWKPATTGALDKLPSILRPLDPHKQDLLVLSGLAHHGSAEGVNAHEHCAFLHLTGGSHVGKTDGKPQAPVSMDQLAAERIGHRTFLPSLELATERSNERRYSFRASGEDVPYEDNPRIAFDRMFRGRAPRVPDRTLPPPTAADAGDAKDSIERSVLDLVMEDARRLQGKVGATDRRKLDSYLDGVRSLERRVALVEAQAKQMARDGVGRDAPIPGKLPATPDAYGDIQRASDTDPEMQAEYIDLMSDLMVLAFQTDATRIATFAVGSDGSLFPGVVTVGFERHFHTLEHQGGNPDPRRADPLAREACRQVSHWYIQQFARTIEKMKAIDEGGVSLLDNTMLLFTSYMADGGHHRQDYPVLMAGGAQANLKTGRHLAYPMGTPMSNLYVEMLDRLGVGVAEFGESRTSPAAAFDGRLPNLV